MAIRMDFEEILKILVERGWGRDLSTSLFFSLNPGEEKTIIFVPGQGNPPGRIIPIYLDLDTDPDMSIQVDVTNDGIKLINIVHMNSKNRIHFYKGYGKLIVSQNSFVIKLKNIETDEISNINFEFVGIEVNKDTLDRIKQLYDRILFGVKL